MAATGQSEYSVRIFISAKKVFALCSLSSQSSSQRKTNQQELSADSFVAANNRVKLQDALLSLKEAM